jgi:hypothetical protein
MLAQLGRASGLLLLAGVLLLPLAARADCVSGTVSAETVVSGPFAGLYKYTTVITWDTPQGLSHATLDCGFDNCPVEVCALDWLFDTPAGAGTGGNPDECDFEFDGEFNCDGDASIGVDYPVLKWNVINTEECEAAGTGTASLCFYSEIEPAEGEIPVVLVKNGQNVCEGMLTGNCPLACAVPTRPVNWGTLKRGASD